MKKFSYFHLFSLFNMTPCFLKFVPCFNALFSFFKLVVMIFCPCSFISLYYNFRILSELKFVHFSKGESIPLSTLCPYYSTSLSISDLRVQTGIYFNLLQLKSEPSLLAMNVRRAELSSKKQSWQTSKNILSRGYRRRCCTHVVQLYLQKPVSFINLLSWKRVWIVHHEWK